MSYFDDPNVLRQIIMDNYQYPRNRGLKKLIGYKQVHMASESCIDDIYVELKINNDIVEDVAFDGVGCTISTASTSIISEQIKGKTVSEAKDIIQNYINMIMEKPYDEDKLEELVAFKNISKQANRIKCATIGVNGFLELLEGKE